MLRVNSVFAVWEVGSHLFFDVYNSGHIGEELRQLNKSTSDRD